MNATQHHIRTLRSLPLLALLLTAACSDRHAPTSTVSWWSFPTAWQTALKQ